jgi:hypothetical protein
VSVVPLDEGNDLVPSNQLGQAGVEPDQAELVDHQHVLRRPGEFSQQAGADGLDTHRVLPTVVAAQLDEVAE